MNIAPNGQPYWNAGSGGQPTLSVTPWTPCGCERPLPHPSYATTPCTARLNGQTPMEVCDGLGGWVDRASNRARCRTFVCRPCKREAKRILRVQEDDLWDNGLEALCLVCQRVEASRHPDGYTDCHCPKNLGRQPQWDWKCHRCRRTAVDRLNNRHIQSLVWICGLGRDHGGTKNWNRDRASRRLRRRMHVPLMDLPCAGCGRNVDGRYNQ